MVGRWNTPHKKGGNLDETKISSHACLRAPRISCAHDLRLCRQRAKAPTHRARQRRAAGTLLPRPARRGQLGRERGQQPPETEHRHHEQ